MRRRVIDAQLMQALRRVTASLLAVALLAAGPLGVSKECAECPPGCPMHAQQASHDSGRKQPGCHRSAERPPAGTVCLRSVCGHQAAPDSAAALLALLARPLEVSAPAPGPRLATPPLIVASLDAPEPPQEPPRIAHA
jgi:hypothetical protein